MEMRFAILVLNNIPMGKSRSKKKAKKQLEEINDKAQERKFYTVVGIITVPLLIIIFAVFQLRS